MQAEENMIHPYCQVSLIPVYWYFQQQQTSSCHRRVDE